MSSKEISVRPGERINCVANGGRRVASVTLHTGSGGDGFRLKRMVIGLGTDLIEMERIERSVARFGRQFLERVFTPGEIAYCQRKKASAESFAARFAAKEAGAKALGTGISRGVGWKEFEVKRQPGQRPELHLSGKAAQIAQQLGVRRLSLSLTHSRQMSMAVVVAED